MEKHERIFIPPPGVRKHRGDRWLLAMIVVGIASWAVLYGLYRMMR